MEYKLGNTFDVFYYSQRTQLIFELLVLGTILSADFIFG